MSQIDTNDLSANLLVNPPAQPNNAFYFDGIKVEDFVPAINWALAKARAEIEAIKNNPEPPTFANTIEALEWAGKDLARVYEIFSTVVSNAGTDELRKIKPQIEELQTKFANERSYDEGLFVRIKHVHDGRAALNLDRDALKLLDDMYDAYIREGILLEGPKKARVQEINLKLAELTTQYSDNTLNSNGAYAKVIENESDLEGIPAREIARFKAAAVKAGQPDKWLIKLTPPPIEVLEYAKNAALREEIAKARAEVGRNGEYDNRPIVLQIVALRDEKAKILGFRSHSEFVLSKRMAGDPDTVHNFLAKNLSAYKPAALAHVQEVKDFALRKDGVTDLPAWDYLYYSRWLKEEQYAFDEETLRPYLSTEAVLDGLRQHAEKLFNIELRAVDGKYSVWHPDVKSYEVYDRADGRLLSLFFADFYARENEKRAGAWMNPVRGPGEVKGVRQIPIVTNACNFTPPQDGKPALLSIRDVETVYHEFGHALHAMLGEGKYQSQTGVNVKWDFVELPSQLQENWVRQKSVLDSFARHYETGQPLPDDLFQKMQRSEKFGRAQFSLRQTFLGLLDMKWHDSDPATLKDVDAVEGEIADLTRTFARTAGGSLTTSFGHLFADPVGYSSGYYSYKWAEVLDADMFETLFEKRGLYNPASARSVRENIYAMGDRRPPMELFVATLGRKPDPSAMFRREGVAPPAP